MFESYNGDFDIQKKHLNDKGELVVSAGEQNCGVIGRTDIVAKIFPSNTITCDMFGNTFYRNFKYKMVTHARVFSLHFLQERFNNKIALYIISAMQFLKHKFSFADMCSWNKIQNLTISLPVLPSRNENKFEIAFEYMESYIKELEAERLEELEAYLLTTGLKDYKLTEQEKVILQDFAKLQKEDSKRVGAFSSLEDYLLYGGSLLDSKKQNFITHALSCLTQRALKSLDTSKWAEFRIGDLFECIQQGKRLKQDDHIQGDLPFVMAGVTNTGISGCIGNDNVRKFPTNAITIDILGNVFYRNYEFGASDDVGVFWNTSKQLNKSVMFFIAASIQKALVGRFDFGKKFRASQSFDFYVSLPVLPLDSIKEDSRNYTHHIDFAFMESFIKEIQKEHFLSLIEYYHKLVSAYNEVLETNGGGALSFKLEEYLSFYESYKTTQAHSTQLQWQEVRIGDLFKKVSAKFVGKGDKFKAVSKTKDNIYKIPVVYAKFGDNGIMYWAREGDFETHDNIISIVYNGAIAAGKVYAQKEKTGILAESYFIRLKEYKVSFEVNLFLKCALEKSLYERFSRENLATWDNKVENEIISLPVLPDNNIAFEYIESFIKALQKELIKELVLWNEKELKVSKELIQKL